MMSIEMSIITGIFLNIVVLVVGFTLGVVFLFGLLDRKSREVQEQTDSVGIDKKQVKEVMEAFGSKPSEEQVNRFIASINKKGRKKGETKGTKREE